MQLRNTVLVCVNQNTSKYETDTTTRYWYCEHMRLFSKQRTALLSAAVPFQQKHQPHFRVNLVIIIVSCFGMVVLCIPKSLKENIHNKIGIYRSSRTHIARFSSSLIF